MPPGPLCLPRVRGWAAVLTALASSAGNSLSLSGLKQHAFMHTAQEISRPNRVPGLRAFWRLLGRVRFLTPPSFQRRLHSSAPGASSMELHAKPAAETARSQLSL